jgi:hypothetical protein
MPDYSPDWTKDDAVVIKACPVPALAEGAILCRIVIQTFAGQRIDTGDASSGGLGGHRKQWYGKQALKGHKNDAEIIALHKLWTKYTIPTTRRGTCYVLGTDGPCDSCKDVLRVLRRSFPLLEFKYVYRRQDLHNVTQDVATAYGWGGDKPVQIDGQSFYYHYLAAVDEPNPMTEKDKLAVTYAINRILPIVRKDVPLKDWNLHLRDLKKREVPFVERAVNYSRERVSMAVNAWGERRRFGQEDSATAASNVKKTFEPLASPSGTAPLTDLEQAEFDRRVTKNATAGSFGNWTAPE